MSRKPDTRAFRDDIECDEADTERAQLNKTARPDCANSRGVPGLTPESPRRLM